MKFKLTHICAAAIFAASAASADIIVTSELQEDLDTFEMTPEDLASWMQDVLEGRDHPCSEVHTMGGKVPRTNTETRRNVAITVGCEENSYFITVGIKTGWKVHD